MGAKMIAPVTFISGVLVGTTAGVLFAPHKGKVTRSKLKHEIESKKEQAQDKSENIKDIMMDAKKRIEKVAHESS